MVSAQQAVTHAVEGAYPHAARVDRQHSGQPRQHFFGRFIRKGHGEQARWRDLHGLNQPGNACGQHTGFAGARTGENQRGLRWKGDGGELLGIEVVQKVLHATII